MFSALYSAAQPALPDIAALPENGTVQLSWVCQYNGVKSMTVLRSADGNTHYSVIGSVKKLSKGAQQFTDRQPFIGKNYYKLAILFSSGLTWMSNRVAVAVPAASLAIPIHTPNQPQPDAAGKLKNQNIPPANIAGGSPVKIDTHNVPVQKTSPAIAAPVLESSNLPPTHPRISIANDEPTENSATLVRAKFVFVDPVSGHVNITLPDDVHSHHYSIKFYDEKNRMIIEVPRLNAKDIVMDHRNFQHRGLYKFILHKDALELEAGYITIN